MYVIEGILNDKRWYKPVDTIDDVINEVKIMNEENIRFIGFKLIHPKKSWWFLNNLQDCG